MSPRSRQITAILLAASALCAFVAASLSQVPPATSPYTPYEHRALYLFNFAKYTTWPAGAFATTNSPFVLGILGPDPFGKDITIINGRTIKGRKLVVKYYDNVRAITNCHLLFLGAQEASTLPATLKSLEASSVLTVAEMPGFIQQGGMINLIVEQKSQGFQTVGFEINHGAATRSGLRIDAQLLKLATEVKK